jgi:hypothetical protein
MKGAGGVSWADSPAGRWGKGTRECATGKHAGHKLKPQLCGGPVLARFEFEIR